MIMAASVFLLAACNAENERKETAQHDENVMSMSMSSNNPSISRYTIGDHVPTELVCMVNDAFMNEKQIPVAVNGNIYYGCCPICKDRLANEETARTAVDPVTNKKVDKASAYIAITGDKGAVSYFEDEANYQKFVRINKL